MVKWGSESARTQHDTEDMSKISRWNIFLRKNYVLWKHAYKSTLLNANCNPWILCFIKTNDNGNDDVNVRTEAPLETPLSCVHLIFTNCFYLHVKTMEAETKNYRPHRQTGRKCSIQFFSSVFEIKKESSKRNFPKLKHFERMIYGPWKAAQLSTSMRLRCL